MKRAVFALVGCVAVAAVGCQRVSPQMDPFMSRIAPTGTGMAQPPAGGAMPYYNTSPAGVAPGTAPASPGPLAPGPSGAQLTPTGAEKSVVRRSTEAGSATEAESSVLAARTAKADAPSAGDVQPAAFTPAEDSNIDSTTDETIKIAKEPAMRIIAPSAEASEPPLPASAGLAEAKSANVNPLAANPLAAEPATVNPLAKSSETTTSEPRRLIDSGALKEISELPKPTKAETAASVVTPTAADDSESKSLVTGGRTRYGYSPDYAKLRGQLEHSASSGRWKLRYIPIDGRTDDYGGSVELADSATLSKSFKDGDYVSVSGQLGSLGADDEKGYAPSYRVSSMQKIQ